MTDDDTPKLSSIPGSGDNMQAAVEAFIRSASIYVQIAPEIARARRVLFDAYIEEGFTKEQALELCKNLAL